MSDADLPEIDEQDQSETFDEDNTTSLGGAGNGSDMLTFEEMPEVYDVTTRLGDADVDGDLAAEDADEIGDDELDEIDLDDDDGDADEILDEALETEPEDLEAFNDGDDDADLDDVDGVDDLEDDEVEVRAVGDVDGAGDLDRVSDYESEAELSQADVVELGYADEEEEEEDELEKRDSHGEGLVPSGPGKPAQGHSGEAADLAADRVHTDNMDEMETEERQDRLLDEGVEETFPASDPVSVKRIT